MGKGETLPIRIRLKQRRGIMTKYLKTTLRISLFTGSLILSLWGCSDSSSNLNLNSDPSSDSDSPNNEEKPDCLKFDTRNNNTISGYENSNGSNSLCPTSVDIPEGITHIVKNAFRNKGLTSVTLPDSLKYIGDYAFYTNNFTSITVPSLNALAGSNIFDSDVLITPSSFVFQLGATTTATGGDNSEYDYCRSIALDDSGNIYCAGYTTGALGETYGGIADAFIMKLNPSGAIEWVTQLGATTTAPGGNNSGDDLCNSITLDDSGNIYCAGYTDGALGEAHGGNYDPFIMKLNPSGALQWVTQLGATTTAPGGNNSGDDLCNSITSDDSGNIYCAGYTNGALGEAHGGDSDPFIMKLNPSGAIEWVTQLGATTIAPGGNNSGDDLCNSITLDNSGNIYCAGYTSGALGETNGGNADAFIMKLNPSGVLQWVTQLGATTTAPGGNNSRTDTCNSITLDDSGNIYCAGYTFGALGETNGGGSDAFVMKLNPSGALQWVTQLGATTTATGGNNSGDDLCNSITSDDSGNIYCAGYTNGALGEANGGGSDAFIMKLNPSGALQWVTQLGATTTAATRGDNSEDDYCISIALDDSGNIYCAGYTKGALGEANGGNTDAFIMKLTSEGKLF